MRLLSISAMLVLCANIVLAHSPLDATAPEDGASLSATPAEITISFKRNLRMTRVNWSRDDGASGVLDLGEQTSFATVFMLPFDASGSGTYMIEWRGLGDDGHPQTGTFSFVVE